MPAGVHRRAALRLGPRWVRSVRTRPAAFATLVVLSALAVAVSVVMPLLLQGISEAAFTSTIASGSVITSGFVVDAQVTPVQSVADARSAEATVISAVRHPRLWTAPLTRVVSTTSEGWEISPDDKTNSYVVVLPSGCGGVRLMSGRCPQNALQVLVPASVAGRLHGLSRRYLGYTAENTPNQDIVGVYDDRSGIGLSLAQPSSFGARSSTASTSALLTGASRLPKLGFNFQVYASRRLRSPARLADARVIRSDISAAREAASSTQGAQFAVRLTSSVTGVLTELDVERQAALILGAVIGVEAVVLGWFAVAVAVGRISRTRAAEWGIGRTRGIRRGRWLASIFVEPATAVVLGGLLGLPIGVAATAVALRVAYGPAAVVDPAIPIVLIAAGLAFVGSIAAVVGASARSTRVPLPDLLRTTTEPRELSRLALVAQVGAALVTVTVVWTVLGQQQVGAGQVALLAPTLVALTVALGALRLGVVLVRRRTSAPSRSVRGLIIGRQLARAPSALMVAVLVTIGVALAAYTLQLAQVDDRIAADQARATVGAAVVGQVQVDRGVDLREVVDRVDPGGHRAMAVEELNPGAGSSRVVAVDTSRLNAVSTWKPAWRGSDPKALLARLDPAVRQDLELRGTQLRIRLADVGDGQNPASGLHLRVVVASSTRWVLVDLGAFRNGELRSLPGAFPCADGCRLVSLGSISSDQYPSGVQFTLLSISTDRQPAATTAGWLDGRYRWRDQVIRQDNPTLPAQARAQVGRRGLFIELEDHDGGLLPAIEPAVGPALLPVLAGPSTELTPFPGIEGASFGVGLDHSSLLEQEIGRAPVLPRSVGDGVLVDLTQMQRRSDPAASQTEDEVWFTGVAEEKALRSALGSHGVHVTGVRTVSEETSVQLQSADRQTLLLAPIAAAGALLLTFLALLGCRIAAAPGKVRDWTTLRSAGYPPLVVARLAALDTAAPSVAAVLLGLIAGLTGFAITVGRLPLFPQGIAHPPPDDGPAVLLLAALLVGSLICCGLVALVAAAIETRTRRA